MKEIVVISGKGGTGKTSITASLAFLGGNRVIVADCDVDAANLHLLLKPDYGYEEDFYSGKEAVIQQDLCAGCDQCRQVCTFSAVTVDTGTYSIDPKRCEGCGYCYHVCPVSAISLNDAYSGKWYRSKTINGTWMIHAELEAGADNSGKLVAKVKNEARDKAREVGAAITLVDGSPGIGCPVISSLSGAAFAVLVTEPTRSALHDLKRVYSIASKFNVPAGCIINKSDLNKEIEQEIKDFLQEQQIQLLETIPYHPAFTKAVTAGKSVLEYAPEGVRVQFEHIWDFLLTV